MGGQGWEPEFPLGEVTTAEVPVISGTVLGGGSSAPRTPAPHAVAFVLGDVLASASLWYQVNGALEPDRMWLLEGRAQ